MSSSEPRPVQGLWIYQRGLIYMREVQEQKPPDVPEPRLDVRFGEAAAAEAGALATAMGHADADEVLSRLEQNRRCFVAWHGEEIASYCWTSMQHEYVGEMERDLNLLDGEAYIWNCATLPRYRRQGLYTALLAYIQTRLAEDGMERAWIGADLGNVPSHRAFDSTGFRPAAALATFRFWRLFGFVSTAPPGASRLRLAAARRLFQLDHLPSVGPLAVGWRSV